MKFSAYNKLLVGVLLLASTQAFADTPFQITQKFCAKDLNAKYPGARLEFPDDNLDDGAGLPSAILIKSDGESFPVDIETVKGHCVFTRLSPNT